MPETIIDLGKKVKAKYPGQYDDLSDQELGAKVKAKYPQDYGDFADVGAHPKGNLGNIPGKQPGLPRRAGRAGLDVVAGIGSGALSTALGASKLIGAVPEGTTLDDIGGAPQNATQKAAMGAEQIGEFFVPAGLVSKGAKAASVFGKAAGLGARIAGEAAAAGGVTALQTGGDTNAARNAALTAGTMTGAFAGIGAAAKPILRKTADLKISRVFAPTTKAAKAEVREKLVPEMLRRGVIARSRASLESMASGKANDIASKIKAAEEGIPDASMPLNSILDDLDKYRQGLIVKGTPSKFPPVYKDRRAYSKATELRSKIERLANMEIIPGSTKVAAAGHDVAEQGNRGLFASRESLRDLRQFLDDEVAKVHGFAIDPKHRTTADLQRYAANSIRRVLNDKKPDIAKLNNEFHFWKTVEDTMSETNTRLTGQRYNTALTLGQVAAAATGSALGALGTGDPVTNALLGYTLPALLTSTGWRTVDASLRNNLASSIASGKTKAINSAISRISAAIAGRESSKSTE